MATKSPFKKISIDQLTPGMFVAKVDLSWYRTPFLSHKQLITDRARIQAMKASGIRTVTIDVHKGKDVCVDDGADAHSAHGVSDSCSVREGDPVAAPPELQTSSVGALYSEAREAVERIFLDLEQGTPPALTATKPVVSRVLRRVIDDRPAVMTHLAIRKIQQYDRSLAAHALDTCILSLVVAIESGVDSTNQLHIGTGALLHDMGYMRLPRNLVRRRHECDARERLLLQQHPTLGVVLLADMPGFHADVIRIVGEHHERTDGSGYPAGLKNGQISMFSEIVGIADWYDGMISHRDGRPAMLPHDAVRQLFSAGEQGRFDKPLVETMIRSIGVYPTGSLVHLNTGEHAVVVGVNPRQRLKPVVKIIRGPKGESYATPLTLDLAAEAADQKHRTVERVLNPADERVNPALYLDGPSSQAT